jgi:rhodanese-related sulfurtransferase
MKKMKNILVIALVALVLPAMFFTSCKTENENKVFETLQTYVTDNNLDLDDMLASWIQKDLAMVDSVQNDGDATNDYYILDIRSTTDFAAGHIAGSVNTTLAGVVAEAANAGGKDILVVCYTGQTAGHACIALRLSGYPAAQVLIWVQADGMPILVTSGLQTQEMLLLETLTGCLMKQH